jgi:hypothetical protein
MTRSLAILLSAALGGCACGQMGQPACPGITVVSTPSSVTVSGSGFSNVPNCVSVSVSGLPPPNAVVGIGQPACSGGTFQNPTWTLSSVGCTSNSPQTVVVAAVDQKTLTSASKTISVNWGQGCQLCGGEGQPVCSNGSCQSGAPSLHPTRQGSKSICTATCGHAQGYSPCNSTMGACGGSPPTLVEAQPPCVTTQNSLNINLYSCFDNAMIQTTAGGGGDCLCIPNTVNTCTTNTSLQSGSTPNTGLCIRGQFSSC